jgi:fructokinase
METRRVYTLGETVLDIIFENNRPIDAKPGGSTLNTSISLGRLGVQVNFISEYANDKVGNLIDAFLLENGVSTEFINRYTDGKSALALAFLDEHKNASYDFYKIYPPKRLSDKFPDFTANDILLFGSFYALAEEIRPYLQELKNRAKSAKALIIYDPNFRSAHAHELKKLKPIILENMSNSGIIRGSNDDFLHIFGAKTAEEAYNSVKGFCPNLIYTESSKGVHVFTSEYSLFYEARKIMPVSTIGAGDTFNSGLIYSLIKLSKNSVDNLTRKDWNFLINNAIDFSAHVCMSYDNYISKEFAATILKT